MVNLVIFACLICIVETLRWTPKSINRSPVQKRIISKIFSSTENKPTKRQENVDMFAAPSKNLNVKIAQSNNNTAPLTATASVVKEPTKIITATVVIPPLSSFIPTPTTPTATSSSSSRTSKPMSEVSLRAEKLRLEAERAQFEVDQSRIDDEKEKLRRADEVLERLLNDQTTVAAVLQGPDRAMVGRNLCLRLLELINFETDSAERDRLIKKYEFFTDEIRRLEPSLHTNIVEDIKKELSQEEQRTKAEKKALAAQKSGSVGGKSSYDRAVAAWVKQTLAGSVGGNVSTVADTDTDAVVTPDSSAEDSGITLYSSGSDAGSSSGSTGNEGYGLGPNGMPNIVRFPASLPTLLLPIIFRSQPIADTDINCLKKSVFSSDVLGNMTVDVSPYLLVFRGTATDTDFQKTWSKIQSRISLLSSPILNVDGGETGNLVSPGMEDRIQIFALPEYIPPESTTNSNRSPLPQEIIPTRTPSTLTEKYSSLPFNPIFVVISKSAVPRPPGLVENSISVVAGLLTFVTAMIYSTDVYSLNKVFVEQVMRGDTDTLDRVFFLALSILAVQSAHDIGHVIAANFHKLAISRPYSLPSLQIGTFGSITSFLGFPKDRKQLFDVAIAGPTLGFISALALTIYGFLITQSATPADLASFPALPTGFFTSSYLLYQLTDGFLHISNAVTSSVSSDIAGTGQAVVDAISNSFTSVHPFVAAGIIGLLVNAFNFMPIGRLDGGRVFMSIFGRKSAQSLSTVVLIAQGLSLLVNASPLPLFWIIAVVLLQRGQDIPPLDDVTPITGPAGEESKDIGYYLRLTALAFCMVMTAAVLIPMPLEISTLTSAVGSSVTDIANGNFPNGIQI